MPVCTIHLISLNSGVPAFCAALSESPLNPLVVARVVRWIILPSILSTGPLLSQNVHWDVLLVYSGTSALPAPLQRQVKHQWTVTSGVPSRLVNLFQTTNNRLLHPETSDVVPLTGALDSPRLATSSQSLELSQELRGWINTFSKGAGSGAVSMLNLLAFKPGKKEEYLKYGKAFTESVGSRRGGVAKIVGNVLSCSSTLDGEKEWDEIALAHYPSIMHFADMLASEDYQAANHAHRVGSLKDTFILCTTELDLAENSRQSKL